MARLLELGELGQDHDMPEVDVRGGRVDPQLHAERPALVELLAQSSLGQDLLRPPREHFEVSHA